MLLYLNMANIADREKIYKEITENSILCIKIFDGEGNLLFINAGGLKEHGIKDSDDLSNWDWLGTIKEKYRSDVQSAMKKALAGEEAEAIFEHVPGRSTRKWCHGTFSPMKDGDGKIEAVLFYSSNITSLKESELRARENEELFRGFLGIAPLCIKGFDGDGRLQFINQHGRVEHHLNKLSEEEVRNWDFLISIQPAYRDKVKEFFAAAKRGDPARDLVIEHVPGTTDSRWCIGDFFVVKDDDGSVKQIYFVSKDISSEKEAQEVMAKRQEDLERMNKFMVNRELKMIELKKRIKELEGDSDPESLS